MGLIGIYEALMLHKVLKAWPSCCTRGDCKPKANRWDEDVGECSSMASYE